jgi:predicted transcriptional regulator
MTCDHFAQSVFALAIDDYVARLLARAGIGRPPVDSIRLARRLEIEVLFDASQEPRGRQTRLAGRSAIFIRPDDRPERRQWAVAHELGETLAHELFHESGVDVAEMSPESREQGANLAASRLLLPSEWFRVDAERSGGDLLSLKRRYETASHELIAFRLLDLPQPAVITVFDQGRQTRRKGNGPFRVPPLDRTEEECWLEVRRFGRAHESARDGRRIQGWPIHEPGWQREILRTTCDAPSHDD